MTGFDNNNKSEPDRSASIRTSRRLSNVQDDHDDDYDLQAMGISDGFRPPEVALNHNSSHVPTPSTSSLDPTTARIMSPPPRPSSISKPHRQHGSFSLRHDGSSREAVNESIPNRASSVSTVTPFVGNETPYEGPSGPSHPYQMYPQNVRLARTASLATTSTVPVSERSYNGPRGPTHPYGMYPQNTVPEADGERNPSPERNMNVGFPGSTDNYQRRLGPEGEEVADLIGPDGHTEQLPPYTRYPEEAYQRKALGMETPQPAPAQPMLSIPAGAGGIGLATRNPEFASTEDLGGENSPHSRQSVRSFQSDVSRHEINAAAQEVTDEKKPLKNWQVAAKRRVWGIVPCWALVLAVVVLVMMGVILGAVIGTLFGRHLSNGPEPDRNPSPAVTTITYDATPLATVPAGLPPLEEGTFAIPLMNTRAPNTCFNDTTQAQTWNCNIVFSQLSMTIEKLDDDVPDISSYAMSFVYNDTYTTDKNIYSYGMQPPDMTDLQLRLVNDTFEASRGPAWAFEIPYNKTVILPEELLSVSTSNAASDSSDTVEEMEELSRRMLFGGDFKRKGVAQTGDKPWICYWDNTILEAFIYAGQNSSFSRPVGSNSVAANTAGATTTATQNVASPVTMTETTTEATQTGVEERDNFKYTYGEGPGVFPTNFPTTTNDVPATITKTETPTTALSSSSSTTDYFSNNPMPPNENPVYPRVLKVEERRIPGFAPSVPWCRQYEVLGDGIEARPVIGDDGKFIDIQLFEDDEEYEAVQSKRSIVEEYIGTRSSKKGSLGNDMSDCGCMWWLT